MEARVGAGPGWKAGRKGPRYKGGSRAAGGIAAVRLRAGAGATARIRVKGKGAALALPALPLAQDTAVTVQLLRDDGPECWQAVFPGPARRNTRTEFRARTR
jgi:hypothetical protein